jgi:phage terminase small subunit
MPPLKKSRWEKFALALFDGKSATESARIAGYSDKNVGLQGHRLSKNAQISARVAELHKQASSTRVASVEERKARLTEIIRARYPDYVECGADGSWVSIGPESPNPGAVAEIQSKTDDRGTVFTAVKLHDPVKAMAELNKMEGVYAPAQVAISGLERALPPVHVTVISPDAKTLVQQIMAGDRTRPMLTEGVEQST